MSLYVRYQPITLGGGGPTSLTIGTFDGQSAAANALTISGNQLYAQSADATHPGMVNISTQIFAGNKSMTGTLSVGTSIAATSGGLEIVGTSAANAVATGYGSGNSGAFIGRSATGTEGSPGAVASGTTITFLGARAHTGSSFTSGSKAALSFLAAETWTPTANGTKAIIRTTNVGSTTNTDRLLVNASGRVSIANSNDTYQLDVTGDIRASASVLSPTVMVNAYTYGAVADFGTTDNTTAVQAALDSFLPTGGVVSSNTLASPTVITSVAHGLTTGQTVHITGTNSTPSLDGSYTVTVVTSDTFSIPVDATAGVSATHGAWIKSAGTLVINAGVKWDYSSITFPDEVTILDYSGWDNDAGSGGRFTGTSKTWQKTADPANKNANDFKFFAPYHPSLVIDNRGDGLTEKRASVVYRQAGTGIWAITKGVTTSDQDLYIEDRNGAARLTITDPITVGGNSTFQAVQTLTNTAGNSAQFQASIATSSVTALSKVGLRVNPLITVTAADTGDITALRVDGIRTVGAGDTSTLTGLYGQYMTYGHSSTSGTTTNAYGINIAPYAAAGTISGNMYDLYLGAITTGGTLSGTHYSIYQADSTASNSLAGTTNLPSLSASLPLQLNSSKNIISSAIDLSSSQATGTLASARFPALTGDVTTSAGSVATTVAKIQSTTVSGTTGSTNVVFSASPTLTGTVLGASSTWSGTVLIGTNSGAALLEVGRVTDGTIASFGQTTGTNNPSLRISSADATGITLDFNGVSSYTPATIKVGGSAALTISTSQVLNVPNLTASRAVFTDSSSNLVSNAITGSGNVVMSASPTLTGTIGAVNQTLSGTLGVTGVATFTAQPIVSSLSVSQAVFSDGSKGLVSNAITGSGSVVMSASPTLTGTIAGANETLSGTLAVTGLTTLSSSSSALGIGAAPTSTSQVEVTSPTALTGTWSNSAGGTAVTGVGTKALTELHIGDNFTINGQTVEVTDLQSDTSVTTAAITGANSAVSATRAATSDVYIYPNGNLQSGGTRAAYNTIGVSQSNFRIMAVGSAATGADATSPGSVVASVLFAGATTTAPQIMMAKSRGTEASPVAVASGDSLGLIDFRGYDGTNNMTSTPARISAVATQAFSNGALGTKLLFATTPNSSTTRATALTLDQDKSATFAGTLTVTGGTTLSSTLGVTGAVTLTNLAGSGSRAVLADSAGLLSAPVSDARLKIDVQPLSSEVSSLEVLASLTPVAFNWDTTQKRVQNHGAQREIGLIAQEVEKVLPQVVREDREGWKSLDYSSLVPLLIDIVKKQQIRIEALESRINQ